MTTVPVTIYTRTTCSPCKTVKWYLQRKGVDYIEKNIDEETNMKEMANLTPVMMVPLVVIGDSLIQGMNLQALQKSLDYVTV
jgi:glutaredoxin